jgi:predicted nucleic acid-binding protein
VILVDTSAWIEFDRATGSATDVRLRDLIASGESIAVTEPIVMELLAGARDDRRESDLRRMLFAFQLVPFDTASDFNAAARIYRRCRAAGVTPRGLLDCAIAAVAWRAGASLLACDRDLIQVARVIGLHIDSGPQ